MSVVRKKHGWVYRMSLAVVTVLAIGVGVLWGVSISGHIKVDFPLSSSSGLQTHAAHGKVYFTYVDAQTVTPNFESSRCSKPGYGGWRVEWHDFGVRGRQLGLPLWLPFAALSIWSTAVIIQWMRIRHRPGHCAACNYNLRGSKQSTSCPECGETI